MAQIDILTQQVALLTQAFNDIYANARKTNEFPNESPLDESSLIRVQNTLGLSEHISVGAIIDKATSFLGNQLLYFSGVTIVGNTVTLLSGSVWRVDGNVYTNVSNVPFTIPYVTNIGDFRSDLIVGGNSNSDVTRIIGEESDIAINPPHPNNKVVICELIISSSEIMISTKTQKTYTEILSGNKQIFTLPYGSEIEHVFINEAEVINTSNSLYPKRYTFLNNVVTIIAPTTVTNNRITILYR